MQIEVRHGDALTLDADVLVLKYAQALYGVDKAVVQRLDQLGIATTAALPPVGETRLFASGTAITASRLLFVGVSELRAFDYEGIREFATRALTSLAHDAPDAVHVALTLHGPGYGLDEIESFRAELAGLLDAIERGDTPRALACITIVEQDPRRVSRLRAQLKELLPWGIGGAAARAKDETRRTRGWRQLEQALWRSAAGSASLSKPHVFVAMPFAREFEDRFHYGIQKAVNDADYLCERADLSAFTGDVISWVRARIDTATLVVGDLSTANPNVFLEIGYAWGKGIPTVLVANKAEGLPFDVRNQRCLIYDDSIQRLESLLREELVTLARRPRRA